MHDDVLDTAVYGELCDAMGSEFAVELVTTFLGDATTMLAELKTAVETGDANGYRRAAHSIKSNAQTFGAGQLAEEAKQMELSDQPDSAAVTALERTFETAAAALQSLINA